MNNENCIEEPKKSQGAAQRRSTIYNLFILVLIVFSWVVVAGVIITPDGNQVIWQVDVLVCGILFVDFVRNLWRAPNKAGYFFRAGGWLDLLGSIPAVPGFALTSLFRLARLNQLVRIVGCLRGKDREEMIQETRQAPAKTALLTITIAALVLITVASLLMLRLERGAAGSDIKTGADAFWWAVVTVTSVGYGDYVPVTFPGRFVAAVLMVFGIGLFAVLTSFVAARLVGLQHDSQRDDHEAMIEIIREENAMIRAELDEIKAFLKQLGEADGGKA